MKIRCILFKIFILFLLSGPCSPSQAYGQAYHELKREVSKILYLDAQVDFKQSPALIIGIYNKGQTYNFSFAAEGADTLSSDQLFGIGEVGHLFIALLCHQLENLEKISLEESIISIDTTVQWLKNFTLNDLINHSAAFPPLPNNLATDWESYSSEDLSKWMIKGRPQIDPDLDYQFSNLHYVLLQTYLEQSSGQSLDSLLINLKDKGLILSHTQTYDGQQTLNQGLGKNGRTVSPIPPKVYNGAKGMISNLEDLMIFIDWMIKDYQANSGSSYWEAQRPINAPKKKRDLYAGQGWHIIKFKKFPAIFLHTGTAYGHRAYIAMVPETQTGVVVLSNSPHGLNGFGFSVLRMLNNNWKIRKKSR